MRRGFTLTEIMVVIIVVAILSEVAMPMVTSIVDESRRSATLMKLKTLKDAITKFKMDLGRLPHSKTAYSAVTIDEAGLTFMTSLDERCPLLDDGCGDITIPLFGRLGMTPEKFSRRWKGPYIETDTADAFADGWGGEIRYIYFNKAVWLHSYGADGEDASPDCFLPNHDTDDITLQIMRVKF